MALLNISTLMHSRRAQIAVAVVVPLVAAAIAVPSFVGGDAEPDGRADVAAPGPTAAQVEPAQTEEVAEQAPEDLGPVPHDGGDIELSVGLRFDRYPAGSVIRAVTFLTRSEKRSHWVTTSCGIPVVR